jgi:hypothetical protein
MKQIESTEKLLSYYREKWMETETKLHNLYFVTINCKGMFMETKLFFGKEAAEWYQNNYISDLKQKGIQEGWSVTSGKADW